MRENTYILLYENESKDMTACEVLRRGAGGQTTARDNNLCSRESFEKRYKILIKLVVKL